MVRLSIIARHLVRRAWHRRTSLFITLTLLLAVGPACLYVLLAYPLARDPRLVPPSIQTAKHLLLVTAHPDDETLFFSPSVLYGWQDATRYRSLLVISSGNYEGIGDRRRAELHASCTALGIPKDRCTVLDHPALQDDPRKWWEEDLIKDLVAKRVRELGPVDLVRPPTPVIVTFDHGGISGHINHRAVSAGVKRYLSETPDSPPAYALQSITALRKYSSLVDLLPTSLPFGRRIVAALLAPAAANKQDQKYDAYNDRALIVSDWATYLRSRAAFAQHQSQYSWDRVLYLVLSRYMWFNTLERI